MNHIIEEDLLHIVSSVNLDWKNLYKKNILVTGASGFIGSYIVETLLKLNEIYDLKIHVISLVRNRFKFKKMFSHHAKNPSLTMYHTDVCDNLKFSKSINYIFHCASQASPKYYKYDPVGTLKPNLIGTINLLELSRKNPIEGFVFISSGEVYGESTTFPTKEFDYGYVDPVSVRSCYAESKKMGENICVSYSAQYDIPTKIVRPFHTFGPRLQLNDGRVYADFINNILNNSPILLKSDGEAIRTFCYISDLVQGIFTILFKGEMNQPYNISNPDGEMSIKDLALMLCSLYPNKKLSLEFEERKDDAYIVSDISRNYPDLKKILDLGWIPKISIAEGFRRTIESYSYNNVKYTQKKLY